MNKDESLSKEISRPITKYIGLAQAVFLLAFFSTPFIWIWSDWSLTWRIGLTAIIGILITKFLHYVTMKVVTEAVESEIQK